MTSLSQKVLAELSQIIDPDLNKDIVSLGLIQNLKVSSEGQVSFQIVLTSSACPVKEEFREKARVLVLGIDGVDSVEVTMTVQSPEGDRFKNLKDVHKIIAVMSCKGGVGKSTVCASLAYSLAHQGYKVGVLDLDIYGPSLSSLFDLQGVRVKTTQEGLLKPYVRDSLSLMSFSLLAGDTPALLRGPLASKYAQKMLMDTVWGALDYLFIDCPPGTSDIHMTMSQSVQLSGAVVVTTAQELSVVDVVKGLIMLNKVSVPIIGLVENMAYLECQSCYHQNDIFGSNQSSLDERLGLPILGRWPLSLALSSFQFSNFPFVKETVDNMVRFLGKLALENKNLPEYSIDKENRCLTFIFDDEEVVWQFKDLRLVCSCAYCYDTSLRKTKLDVNKVSDAVYPENLSFLGHYAVGIRWSDGHNSGVYSYSLLKRKL